VSISCSEKYFALKFQKEGLFMEIGDKIRAARKRAGLTQKDLAAKINVTTRCIQYYESNIRKPQTTEMVIKLAAALNEEVNYFLSEHELAIMRENEMFLGEAESKFGKSGKAQARQIIENAQALFAGGDLEEEDKEAFFQAITEMYFESKKNNSKK
jgi:transcriptional regulator with XRE-family HTH domain